MTAHLLNGLNAPYGAKCFLTSSTRLSCSWVLSLNAPYGARCFLTSSSAHTHSALTGVLMHLMALGAFCPDYADCVNEPIMS